MKTKYWLSPMLLPLLAAVMLGIPAKAQDETRQEKENARIESLKKMIEAKNYTFIAQSATPMSGRTRSLTYPYQLKVKPDSVIADLPYYGRAYVATIGDTHGGVYFTSTDFEYHSKNGNKGGWEITIAPKQVRDVEGMILNVSTSGYGTLQVTSNTRQMISFYGYVQESK